MDLVDWQIRSYVECGMISIVPFNLELINPNSYDVTLGSKFIVYSNPDNLVIDPYDKSTLDALQKRVVNASELVVYPDEFILARTTEVFKLPRNVKAQLDGKSSNARLGIEIHQNGGYIDAGFFGSITLEIIVKFPTKLHYKMPIGQLCFTETRDCEIPYNMKETSKYNGQLDPTESMYYKNKKIDY